MIPGTICKICANVPLDNSYKNQLTFGSPTEQYSYFSAKRKVEFGDWTFQRFDQPARVPVNQLDLLDCNYMMFQNSNYGDKWFYAFITRVEYINPDTSYVYFEVDAWQTFYFDITIHPCFVEREHTNTDNYGEHLIEESLATGEYVTITQKKIDFNNMFIIMATSVTLPYAEPANGNMYCGIYSGLAYYAFDPKDGGQMASLNTYIVFLAEQGKSDAIVEIYMVPKQIVPAPSTGEPIHKTDPSFLLNENVPNSGTLQGYKPHNNKTLTYPFRCCVLSSMTGGGVKLKYEYFSGSPTVRYGGGFQSSSGVFVAPVNYKGCPVDYGTSVELSNFPQCSWSRDNYANWLATQNIRQRYAIENTTVKAAANTLWQGGMSLLSGALNLDPVSGAKRAVTGALNNGYNYGMNLYDIQRGMQEESEVHQVVPPSVQGSASSVPAVATGNYYVLLEERSVTADYARSIDQYFDMFGYRINKLKVPNITGRKYWNYVKTVGATITGNCPRPFLLTIQKMFETGVTFWHGDYVGDYTLDNSIGGYVPPTEGYFLTVVNGSGSGEYAGGAVVPITANKGQYTFKEWTSNGGGTFANPNAESTTFTMPSASVIVYANYNTPGPPEPTGDTIADYMETLVGHTEWDSTICAIQTWYYGSCVKDAWCCTCLTYCADHVGVSAQVPKNASVQSLYTAMKRNNPGQVWEATVEGRLPVRGDICFFITSQSPTVLHHCGVVTNMHSDCTTFDYCSGNTTNPGGGPDGIFTHSTTIGKSEPSYVKYFAHVTY